MNARSLDIALGDLSKIQRRAVDWNDGSMLVLAGPGSGKTQVLTCRIARLLDSSRGKKFRVLALTFTNKAADEMKERVAAFVPGLEERATIGTFHSFCAQVLRQHGVHIGIKPDFTIYSRENDRLAVLEDALAKESSSYGLPNIDYSGYLKFVDRMKARLIKPDDIEERFKNLPDPRRAAEIYRMYEEELRTLNALDFNSLIFEAHELVKTFPVIAEHYQVSYPYWLIDEFQDTNQAQYQLVRTMAGEEFQNVFAVADDDQIIYRWNGASFRQIQRLRRDFSPELIQLPTNYRCPGIIVEAANRLVAYNVERTEKKKPLATGKTDFKFPKEERLQVREFVSEEEEADEIAGEIAACGSRQWSCITVLARTRALLENMREALLRQKVPAVISQRREDFLSPEFRWLVACITQALRPLDRHNVGVLVEAYNRVAGIKVDVDHVVSRAEISGESYLDAWIGEAENANSGNGAFPRSLLLESVRSLSLNSSSARKPINDIVGKFDSLLSNGRAGRDGDLSEDMAAWREITHNIGKLHGRKIPLNQFLQQLQLRSKEPSPDPESVTLMTIHAAKGLQFDIVYVIGLAEEIMPSYQSLKKGDDSPEMEEERRNCFVAITRAKERLILSRAGRYSGYPKEASRFLVEMGLTR